MIADSERKGFIEFFRSILPVEGSHDLNASNISEIWKQYEEDRDLRCKELEATITNAEQQHRLDLIALEQRKDKEKLEIMKNSTSTGSNSTGNGGGISPEILEKITGEKDKLSLELASLTSKFSALETELLNRNLQTEEMKSRLTLKDESIRDQTDKLAELQKDHEHTLSGFEEKIVYLQMQMERCKTGEQEKNVELEAALRGVEEAGSRIAVLELELEEKNTMLQATNQELHFSIKKIAEIEPELEAHREKSRNHEKNLGSAAFLKAEQEALLVSTRKDLKTIHDKNEFLEKRVIELENIESKSITLTTKVSELEKNVESLQMSVDEKNGIISRLRSDIQTAETNHGMRTAMLATCEAQLESLQGDIKLKEETLKASNEKISILEERIAVLESNLKEAQEDVENLNTKHAAQLQSNLDNYNKEKLEAKASFEQEINATRKELTNKISVARTLLNEREEEVKELSRKKEELQSEIESGAPNERRIFEIATAQSKRDTLYGQHKDSREIAFLQIQEVLAAKDLELASMQQSHTKLVAEVADLRRTSRREGINMDYLKNIILQYMKLPIAAPERMSLVPVIATLLQFNKKELTEAEGAMKSPMWNSLPVKEVKRMNFSPSPGAKIIGGSRSPTR